MLNISLYKTLGLKTSKLMSQFKTLKYVPFTA